MGLSVVIQVDYLKSSDLCNSRYQLQILLAFLNKNESFSTHEQRIHLP